MKVKRYVAGTIQEAIARVKSDLGRNAIILHTKQFKEGGFLGLFAERRFEVIAAVDENAAKAQLTGNSEASGRDPAVYPALRAEAAGGETAERSFAAAEERRQLTGEPLLQTLQSELGDLKKLIMKVTTPLEEAAEKNSSLAAARKQLRELQLEEDVIDELLLQIPNHVLNNPNVSEKIVLARCGHALVNSLQFDGGIQQGDPQKQQIVAFIGPTGVGKTTTIAKLAANFSLYHGRKVGLVTLDTFRIAAVEHLKTYGDIINLPVEVIYSEDDFDRALEKLRECDLILVDTAGRSPYNQLMLNDLKRFLSHPEINQIMLVISATTQYHDMQKIVERFSLISFTHLIFSKLDETDHIGPIINLAWKNKIPLAYLTTGQNVPDDIELANPARLISHLYKGAVHG
ncbi:flagellar biosynthesis protein FlhF [Hydrogenispora ethanolica]|jgi:flagellar biosynthesis protein FlhF|uniref:Flagellar biosynthesis protein FlhF n=1 Tax=Hydrogenispora ethanolica TaxID=1082276 RepID=A0A4R1RLD2_HYDET|nr:flagellar biosynthesis protein FlhF [Hydrogenispora ethanolica]TCL66562.1 flagellar biosynthesis protein FlhF [Hydrogenispora ethanolica]